MIGLDISAELAREVLSAAPDALLAIALDGTIVFANDRAARLFGRPVDELAGRPIDTLVAGRPGGDHAILRAAVAPSETPPVNADLTVSGQRADGSTFPAEISLNVVADDTGRSLVLASVRDVRRRIEVEAERRRTALETQREQGYRLESLGQLAGGVAHDFNNLLGVILNYATLIARKIEDPVTAADLQEIRAAAERGASLTGQLLTFARRDHVAKRPIDVGAVVSGVAELLRRPLGERIVLAVDIPDRPVWAMSSETQLEQVLVNLIHNAREAMPGGGVVTVTARSVADAYGPCAVLTVTDTGAGMPPEVVARAFEPFFTTKSRERGAGLGLATVYGIVRHSEGEVHIRSAVGEGTTVTIELPGADDPNPRDRASAADPQPAARPSGERILLVEDEAPLRIATARLLADAGYTVLAAADGVEALAVFDAEAGALDLVVTDIAMPHMRGDELARQFKLRSPTLPVIFVTGYNSGASPLTGVVLSKPVVEADLLQAVREVLDD